MDDKTREYCPPLIVDLGSFEAEGFCNQGSIVALCTVGTYYHEDSPCAYGSSAKAGCNSGGLPVGCNSGYFAAQKRETSGIKGRF